MIFWITEASHNVLSIQFVHGTVVDNSFLHFLHEWLHFAADGKDQVRLRGQYCTSQNRLPIMPNKHLMSAGMAENSLFPIQTPHFHPHHPCLFDVQYTGASVEMLVFHHLSRAISNCVMVSRPLPACSWSILCSNQHLESAFILLQVFTPFRQVNQLLHIHI